MISPVEVRRRAKALVKTVREQGGELMHKDALNRIAQEAGSADWQNHKQAWKTRDKEK